MEVMCGPTVFDLALEPGELALYIRYGIIPRSNDLSLVECPSVEIVGFSVPICYRFDVQSGMGIIEPIDQTSADLLVRWPLFVIEWTECLTTGRKKHGISYTVGPMSVRVAPGNHRV